MADTSINVNTCNNVITKLLLLVLLQGSKGQTCVINPGAAFNRNWHAFNGFLELVLVPFLDMD
jgi:hypothetical protein